MIVTRRHLPRRTFLKGMGAVIALPMLDAMTPAFARAAHVAKPRAVRLAFTYVPNGIMMTDWTPAATGAGVRVHADPEAARAVPRGHAGPLRPRAPQRRGARRRPRRPRPRRRVVPDRRASAQDRRRRHPERHLGRPDRGAAHRRRRRASRRSSSAATTRGRSATATPATPARTPTASRGAARRRRCRRRPTRAWCSSACSATSTPASRPRRGRAACATAAASSTSSTSARRSCRPTSGPSDRRKLDEYLSSIREIERRIETRRAGHDRAHARRSTSRPASRSQYADYVEPDVRSAAGRLPDRLDPRRHDDDGPRGQHADLSGDRRPRSAPPAHPPPRQPGVDREGHAGQHDAHGAVRRLPRQAQGHAGRRRHRCSITR